MHKKLQNLVATQYEKAGFAELANEISGANGVAGVRKIAIKVIKQCMKADPSGFGNDVRNISVEGESNNG